MTARPISPSGAHLAANPVQDVEPVKAEQPAQIRRSGPRSERLQKRCSTCSGTGREFGGRCQMCGGRGMLP